MSLLIITQKVDINDGNLGFFHGWLEKFSKKLDEVYVICLWKGEYNLPKNVQVFSMGKEKGVSKIGQFFRLQKYLMQILPKVDGVFVHMCPIYAVASFPLAKIFRKKMILWYLHKSVGWKLRMAEKLVDKILTASEESCRLKERKKIRIVGHGSDLSRLEKPKTKSERFKIVSVGRISPIKDQKTLIIATDILVNKRNIRNIEIRLIGEAVDAPEKKYSQEIKKMVEEKNLGDFIEFLGAVPHEKMPEIYRDSDLVINLSQTGSIDKVVVEGINSGTMTFTCNEAFRGILEKKYIFEKENPQALVDKIIQAMNDKNFEKRAIESVESERKALESHNLNNLDNLIDKIISEF